MMKSKRLVICLLLWIMFLWAAPSSNAERCRDCVADACAMVGGYGFRSCQEFPIYRWQCIRRLPFEPYDCAEYEQVVIDYYCRVSLGGCIGAY